LLYQGAGRHDHHRYAEHLPLSRSRQRQGVTLRGGRRPRGLYLVRRRTSDEDGGLARLDSAGGGDRAPALSAALPGRRRAQPARRARPLSWQDGVSHPRHQSALNHRPLRFTDLYTRVKVGTRVVVLPGRPPATEAAMPLAPPAGASVLPSDGSVTIGPLGPPPSAMAR